MTIDPKPNPIKTFLLKTPGIRVFLLFAFHVAVFAACYAFAWLVRFEFSAPPPEHAAAFRAGFPVILSVQLLIGFLFGFYRGWWRYVGLVDVMRLVAGLTTALLVLTIGWYLGPTVGVDERFVKAPRGVFLIDWAFALLTLFGARAMVRLGRDRFRPGETPQSARRVLIVGAGDAGETLAREIEHRAQLGMKVVGFIDDQRAKWGSQIRGISVFGPISDVASLADSLSADEALLAIPSASGKRLREIISHLSDADLQFKTIPGIDHLVSGKVHVTQLRPVNIEDLMRRKQIDLPGDPVRALFRGKRVLVTGAGGTIGSELASQVLGFEPESLVLVERSEYLLYESHKRLSREIPWATSPVSCRLADIQDDDIMRDLLLSTRPHIVLHAAAHKHVPLGEENPSEYLRNNTIATRSLGEAAVEAGVERFVLISSDKAIRPTSVMGATKRAAEITLRDLSRKSKMNVTIVRFGNVIGSSGSVIPLFMEQIAAGGPITVTHPDVTRYFIRTSEAISLVLQAATLGDGGQVFMLDMGEPVKIADLARDLIRLSNHSEDEIPIEFTGLRPGEKLFEEIRLEAESVQPTMHPQIVVTKVAQPDTAAIESWLGRARSCRDDTQAGKLLREIDPEYQPATVAEATPRVSQAPSREAERLLSQRPSNVIA